MLALKTMMGPERAAEPVKMLERRVETRKPLHALVPARVLRPQRPTIETAVVERHDRAIVLAPPIDAEALSHVWLEFDLEVRPVRVLAQVIGHNTAGTHLRIRHAWPKDEELLERLAV